MTSPASPKRVAKKVYQDTSEDPAPFSPINLRPTYLLLFFSQHDLIAQGFQIERNAAYFSGRNVGEIMRKKENVQSNQIDLHYMLWKTRWSHWFCLKLLRSKTQLSKLWPRRMTPNWGKKFGCTLRKKFLFTVLLLILCYSYRSFCHEDRALCAHSVCNSEGFCSRES